MSDVRRSASPGVEVSPSPARPVGRDHGRTRLHRSGPSSASRSLRGAGTLGAYVALGVVAYLPSWAHPATVAVGAGSGDPAQSMWYLRWVPWAIGHGHNPLFTTVANYPAGVNMVDQTSVLLLGLLATPVTLLWGPVASYNVCTTLALALSAAAGYLLCRRFVAWRPAAFAGGLLYGFSPYMVGQGFGHLNLVFVPIPPLIFLVLHDLVIRRAGTPRREGLRLGALVIAQFFISTEILATTALFAGLTVAVLTVGWPHLVRLRFRPVTQGLAWAGGVAIVVVAYPVYELLAGPQHITGSIIGFRYYFSALLAPLLPTPLLRFGTQHLKALGNRIGGNGVENGTYLGAPLVVFTAFAAALIRRPGRRGAVRVAAVMAVVAFVLSLGVTLHVGLARFADVGRGLPMPAAVIYKIPLLNQAFPVRYSLYIALFVSLVLACGLQGLRDWASDRWSAPETGPSVAIAAAIIALLPLVPAWPYPSQANVGVPAFFTSRDARTVPAGSAALVYPYPDAAAVQPELWQAEADLRFTMPGGYFLVPAGPGGGSATSTPTATGRALTSVLRGPAPARSPALMAQLRRELAAWRVRSLLVQPVGNDPVGFFTWLAGRPPDATAGGMVEWYNTSWVT